MRFAEVKNLARSVRNDRPGKGAGTPERNQSMFDEAMSFAAQGVVRNRCAAVRRKYNEEIADVTGFGAAHDVGGHGSR